MKVIFIIICVVITVIVLGLVISIFLDRNKSLEYEAFLAHHDFMDREKQKQKMLSLDEDDFKFLLELEEAGHWLLVHGRFVYQRKGYLFLESKLTELTSVHLWSDPLIDEGDTIALFQIKHQGFLAKIKAVEVQEVFGDQYEYWVVHTTSQLNKPHVSSCRYVVTKVLVDDEYGYSGALRKVVYANNEFFTTFTLDTGQEVLFDVREESVCEE